MQKLLTFVCRVLQKAEDVVLGQSFSLSRNPSEPCQKTAAIWKEPVMNRLLLACAPCRLNRPAANGTHGGMRGRKFLKQRSFLLPDLQMTDHAGNHLPFSNLLYWLPDMVFSELTAYNDYIEKRVSDC